MTSGFYDVYAGNLRCERMDVAAGTHGGSISGPLWAGLGLIDAGKYSGTFVSADGQHTGHHVATPNDDGSLSVKAFFDGTPEPIELTWKPQP